MPEMDGFEACRILKSQQSTQYIPIIFMTARTDMVDKIKGFELGAADYITKPFQYEEVLARVNTHLNLHKLQRQLEVRNMQLDAFARTVAHDLKSPLTTVICFADELIDTCTTEGLLNDQLISYIESISQAGDKMASIINALLLLARTTQTNDINIHPLNMSHIVAQAQQRLTYTIKDCQAEISVPATFPTAKGYAPWIEEIWANYLSNGLKYGGSPPRIELGGETQKDGMIRFWVRDNGQGLSEQAQAKLFTPFTRLHKERAEGHGLGLSIVQQIAERLGGQVGVESQIGEGCTFYFTLPASDKSTRAVVC